MAETQAGRAAQDQQNWTVENGFFPAEERL